MEEKIIDRVYKVEWISECLDYERKIAHPNTITITYGTWPKLDREVIEGVYVLEASFLEEGTGITAKEGILELTYHGKGICEINELSDAELDLLSEDEIVHYEFKMRCYPSKPA